MAPTLIATIIALTGFIVFWQRKINLPLGRELSGWRAMLIGSLFIVIALLIHTYHFDLSQGIISIFFVILATYFVSEKSLK